MTKQNLKAIALIVMAGLAVGATGCKSVCRTNQRAGLASVVCQPEDREVAYGESATFKVKACGESLAYQWHFLHNGIEEPLTDKENYTGIQERELRVAKVDKSARGLYWCEVQSISDDGRPKWTQTRTASLGTYSIIKNNAMSALLLQNPVRSTGSSANGTCPARCGGNSFTYTGVVVYDNSGSKYRPKPGITKGTVRVSINNTPVSNTQYEVLWRVTRTDYCCATKVAGSPTDREFPCDSGKAYTFTVYLYPAVSQANGTEITMELMPDNYWQ